MKYERAYCTFRYVKVRPALATVEMPFSKAHPGF